MQTAPRPSNETDRLTAVYRLNVLDTPPEERFDRITRLASNLFKVPIAYVAMVDEDRQWFKSKVGLAVHETPRDISFCGHAILQDEPLIITDSHLDPRFVDNPMVTGPPFIRFYAGRPLLGPEGDKVGTLCLADSKPRSFDDNCLKALNDLAVMVEDQLKLVDLIKLQDEVVAAKEELQVRNNFIREAFGRYMTEEVAASLLANPEALKLGGNRRKVSILMSDLRGFTPMTERLEPEEVVEVLNRYLGKMVDVIRSHGGTIDAFIGDAILVIFGAPISTGSDAERAVACAVDMQLHMAEVNEENAGHGLPQVQMGIGISTGDVIVGNIGSEHRMHFSAIGGPVNLAARIESFTLGGQILIGEETLKEVPDLLRIDGRLRVKVKGIDDGVCIYEVGGIGGEYDLYLPQGEYQVEPCRHSADR